MTRRYFAAAAALTLFAAAGAFGQDPAEGQAPPTEEARGGEAQAEDAEVEGGEPPDQSADEPEGEAPADPEPAPESAEAVDGGGVAPVDSGDPAEAAGEEGEPLDVVIVSARRGERIDMEVPRSVGVIDMEEEVIRRPAHNLPRVLEQVPGVHGQATAPGQGSPMIRGLTGYHVLTLIDGVRLNGSYFRSGPNQYNATIDPLIIDRVEVVKGPGSVLYGSDALGGVISLMTRDPVPPSGVLSDDTDPWVELGAYGHLLLPTRAGADVSSKARLEVQGGVGPAAALLGYDYHGVGDREGGEHEKTLDNTAYSETNGDAKVVIQATQKERVTLAVQRFDQRNVPRSHSTVDGDDWRGTDKGSNLRRDLDQSRTLTYLSVETRDRGIFSRLKGNVSVSRVYENQTRVTGSGTETKAGFEVWTFGAFVEGETDLPLPVDTTLIYGADYYHDSADSFQYGDAGNQPRGPIADDARYDLFGVYTGIEVRPTEWLDLYAGIRYSLAHVLARDVDPDPSDAFDFGRLEETYDDIVGSGAITLRPVRWLSVVGSVSQGFRAPNLSDTTSFQPVSSGSFDSPSPDIDAEKSLTLEAGLKWQSEFVRGQLFYSYTFLDDFLQRVATGNQVGGLDEFVKENVSEGAIQAIEGQCELLWDPIAEALDLGLPKLGLSFIATFSWTRGKADRSNGHSDNLRRAPPTGFTGRLRWTEPGEGWLWAEVEAEFYRRQTRLSSGDIRDDERIPPGGTPGYALWHVRGGVNLLDDALRVSLGLENIFDRDYRVHGSGSNGWGRTLVGALEFRW
jgi:hemoglobin/transferrin/lactoferrin receptor protein